VSLFIEPSEASIDAAVSIKAPVVELHTGSWCHAIEVGETAKAEKEFARLKTAARYAAKRGIEVHAGHGLDFDTARTISALPEIVELNIGHFLIGEAVFTGLKAAIKGMRKAMDEGVKARPGVRAEVHPKAGA
jgi:pyridoxine 5-phosphate synthase